VTAIVFACATISNDNLQDLKTGQLVGRVATPAADRAHRRRHRGRAVIPPILNLLAQSNGFAGAPNVGVIAQNPLPAPQATLISALAQGVIGGSLDWKMIGIGLLVGLGVILIDESLGFLKVLRIPPLAGRHRHLPADVRHVRGRRRRRHQPLVQRTRQAFTICRPSGTAWRPRRFRGSSWARACSAC
jgi:putative OPT family oligopeptide transporter